MKLDCRSGRLVLGGDVIARAPLQEGQASWHAGPGTSSTVDGDQQLIIAKRYGRVAVNGNSISIASAVQIDDDQMRATIDITALSAGGQQVTVDDLLQALNTAGVTRGVDRQRLEATLDQLEDSDAILERIPAAFGERATGDRSAGYSLCFTIGGQAPAALNNRERKELEQSQRLVLTLVRQGSVIARAEPATRRKHGFTVTGRGIDPPARSVPDALRIIPGENVELDKETKDFRCAVPVCGYVDFVNGRLTVRSPLTISRDNLQATLEVHSSAPQAKMLNRSDVEQLAEAHGLVGELDWDAIETAFQRADLARSVQRGIRIACGMPPGEGTDARLEWLVKAEAKAATIREDGRMDYRERDSIRTVSAGTLLCRRIPPTRGRAGRDVLGNAIEGKYGRDVLFREGKNIRRSEDGNEYYAAIDGVLAATANTVEVREEADIAGDVDYESGNVRAAATAVHVRGTVNTGFVVEAGKSVTIDDTVEDSQIESAGDVLIRGGVIHLHHGFIRATGSVKATYAQHARIEAGGDITLTSFATNSDLRAGGAIIIKGKGRLIGGTAKAGLKVIAREVGSPSELRTQVQLGADEEVEAVEGRLFAIAGELEQIGSRIGAGFDRSRLSALPLGHRIEVSRMLERQEQLTTEQAALLERREAYFAKADPSKATLDVYGRIMPGTSVSIFGRPFEVERPIRMSRLRFDMEKGQVVVEPLGPAARFPY